MDIPSPPLSSCREGIGGASGISGAKGHWGYRGLRGIGDIVVTIIVVILRISCPTQDHYYHNIVALDHRPFLLHQEINQPNSPYCYPTHPP